MLRHFEQELDQLKSTLIQMGSLVDAQIDAAARALFDADMALARRVIADDDRVNAFDTEIDKLCQQIFALNQPVAADLRLLMSALRINHQIERIGDIAVNIAERVESLAAHTAFLRTTQLEEMLQIARIMVSDSLNALFNNNPSLAMRVLESDDVVDDLDRNNFRRLVGEMQRDHSIIEPATHLIILSRHIERLADHATNIAEDVIFLVDAKIVKHNALDE